MLQFVCFALHMRWCRTLDVLNVFSVFIWSGKQDLTKNPEKGLCLVSKIRKSVTLGHLCYRNVPDSVLSAKNQSCETMWLRPGDLLNVMIHFLSSGVSKLHVVILPVRKRQAFWGCNDLTPRCHPCVLYFLSQSAVLHTDINHLHYVQCLQQTDSHEHLQNT